MKFKVEPKIFEKFPGVRIGVLVVLGMNNKREKAEIARLLTSEEEKKKKELAGVDLKAHSKIGPWRKIYRQFGSKPREYRSSVEALLRRVVSESKLPNINPMVDLYNYISIKHLVPAGAEDLDKVKGDIVLGFAQGNEKGKYIGSDEASTCYPGEVVYKDDLGFICRRWNWREGDRTKIMPESENAVVVIEANQNVSDEELRLALKETAEMIREHLKAKVEIKILDAEKTSFDIDFKPGRKLTKEDLKELKEKDLPAGRQGKVVKKKIIEKAKEVPKRKLIDKNSISYQLRSLVWQTAKKFAKDLELDEVNIEHPENPEHGDYSSNIAMAAVSTAGADLYLRRGNVKFKCPLDLARLIVKNFPKTSFLEKIEVVPPGFINFWLSKDWLGKQMERVLGEKDGFGKLTILKDKKILLEHTSPDPIKTLHIGHLRNNFLGMTMARILEFLGAKVTKDCINNDRGVHVCRAMWGYLAFGEKEKVKRKKLKLEDLKNFQVPDEAIEQIVKDFDWREALERWSQVPENWLVPGDSGLKPDHFDLVVYAVGARAEDQVEGVGEQVREMLRAWENEEKEVQALWRIIIDWSLKGYQETYARIGSVHDHVWHESKLYKKGKELVYEGLKKGVFKKSQGAIVSDLKDYGLPDTVLIKSDGTALYHTQDINLTLQKRNKFPSDLYIWDIGNDQILYLKQLYAMCEQLGIGQVSDYFHMNYGYVYLKGEGRMSSRKGTIIKADDLFNEANLRARKIIETSAPELRKIREEEREEVAETVGLAALKYGLLKFGREKDIYFDIEKSISLEGNSGPYLQYTYARAKSVLGKAAFAVPPSEESLRATSEEGLPSKTLRGKTLREWPKDSPGVNKEERALLRTIYKFPEIVLEAGESYSPNLICNFLYDLAQKFNLFYNQHRILQPAQGVEVFRLALTASVAQILENGLNLLGIQTLERM